MTRLSSARWSAALRSSRAKGIRRRRLPDGIQHERRRRPDRLPHPPASARRPSAQLAAGITVSSEWSDPNGARLVHFSHSSPHTPPYPALQHILTTASIARQDEVHHPIAAGEISLKRQTRRHTPASCAIGVPSQQLGEIARNLHQDPTVLEREAEIARLEATVRLARRIDDRRRDDPASRATRPADALKRRST